MKCVNCGKGIHLYERSWVHDEHGNSGRGPQKCALSDLLIDLVAKIEQGEIITATPEGAQDERARFLKHYLKGGRTYMSGDEAREKHWETWQAAIQGQK